MNKNNNKSTKTKFCYYIETKKPLYTKDRWNEFLKISRKYRITHLQPLSNLIELQLSNPDQNWKIVEKIDELKREIEKIRREDCLLCMKEGRPLNKIDKITKLPYMFRMMSSEDLKELRDDIE